MPAHWTEMIVLTPVISPPHISLICPEEYSRLECFSWEAWTGQLQHLFIVLNANKSCFPITILPETSGEGGISMDNMTEWFVFYPLIRQSRVSVERLNYRLTWEWEIQLINHWLFFVPLLAYYRVEELGDREDNYQLITSPPLTLCWTGKWRTVSESLSVLNIKCPSQWLMLANLLSRRGSHDQRCPAPLPGLSWWISRARVRDPNL